MEVTPELYAWLTDLNIINPFSSLKSDVIGNFMIPDKTIQLMIGGKYMDVILQALQTAYNKFYKLKLDNLSNLKNLKDIPEDTDYISNSIKYANWHLINEMLNKFGISYTEDQIMQICNGDREYLLKVITQIYYLTNQFLKHTVNETTNKSENKKEKITEKNLEKEKEKTQIKQQITDNKSIISGIETDSNIKINVTKPVIKKQKESVNINDIDPNKPYDECSSALEFFILSLCKNLDMKPRQAVALLSNNRKYLTIICTKGIKGDFTKIKKWLNDLNLNYEIMAKNIMATDDGLNISYSTIGAALLCNDSEIPLLSAQLINKINLGVKMNWEWFKNEGLDSLIYSIIKNEDKNDRLTLINVIYDLTKEDTSNFFMELRKKIEEGDKKKIFEFLSCIIPLSKKMNSFFNKDMQNFVFDICFNETKDISSSISILSDAFYYYDITDETLTEKIIEYFKKCVRSKENNIYSTAVAQVINLMKKFGKTKSKYGPQLYKILVSLFLEGYNCEEKRQFILENFEKFLNEDQEIPVDILIEPYLKLLTTADNYSLTDFEFLFKMVEHPRMSSNSIIEIIKFLLKVILHSEIYSRTANIILGLIFEKEILNNKCTPEEIEKISNNFINFINSALDNFMNSIKPPKNKPKHKIVEKKYLLETPFDIINENFTDVNEKIYDKLVLSIRNYRKIKKQNSNALLAMLWNFPDHDDILLRLEEENRPQYESIEVEIKKKQREIEENDKRDIGKQLGNYFDKMRNFRQNKKETVENKNKEKQKKEEKIKKELEQQRKINRILSGASEPKILTEISTVSLPIIQTNQMQKEKENKENNSNMLQAIDSASQKYINKGDIRITSPKEVKMKNNFIKKSDKKLPKFKEFQMKKKDDVIEKYGKIPSVDYMKKKLEVMNEYKNQVRLQSIKNFILPEGTIIKILPNGLQENIENYSRKYSYISQLKKSNQLNLVDLKEEEDREIKAIDGYNYEYRKNIKFYFRCYSNELDNVIKKRSLLKLLRDKNINRDKLDLDEFTNLIRGLFNENLNEFTFEQFSNLLIHLSYFVFRKVRPCLTIGESYGNLVQRLNLDEETESTIKTRKKMQPVINLLLYNKENNIPYNLPEGFKFNLKGEVKFKKNLPQYFIELLGESKVICYELVEEIIFNIFNSSIIEPTIELDSVEEVIIEPEKIHKWTPEVTMAYVEMGKDLKKYGMIACDAFEEGYKNFLKGKNEKGEIILHPQEKKSMEEYKLKLKNDNKQTNFLIARKKEIDEKLEEYKKKKQEEKKEKLKERKVLREKHKEYLILQKQKFEKVEERRKKKEEEKQSKLISRQQEVKEKRDKKDKELMDFYRKQKEKLKAQFNEIKRRRSEYINRFQKKDNNKIERLPSPSYLQKDKEYITFESNLNQTMEDLIKRSDINAIFNKYNKHLQYIYDVYSKIGYNKISFFSKEVIHINEFKQFLVNFTVLGLLISTDQMLWIFNKVAKQKQDERDGQVYLDFEDFQKVICFLAIFSKFTERSRKLLPSDIDNTNGETIEYFIKFLGLRTPFNKKEMENFINDRRGMTMKNLLDLQREIKTNVNDYKNGEYVDKEELKRKQQRKEKMKKQREKKQLERENAGNENSPEGNSENEHEKSKSGEEEEEEGEEEEDEEEEKKKDEKVDNTKKNEKVDNTKKNEKVDDKKKNEKVDDKKKSEEGKKESEDEEEDEEEEGEDEEEEEEEEK